MVSGAGEVVWSVRVGRTVVLDQPHSLVGRGNQLTAEEAAEIFFFVLEEREENVTGVDGRYSQLYHAFLVRPSHPLLPELQHDLVEPLTILSGEVQEAAHSYPVVPSGEDLVSERKNLDTCLHMTRLDIHQLCEGEEGRFG